MRKSGGVWVGWREGNLPCVGGRRSRDEKGWGELGGRNTGLSGSKTSPQGVLAGAKSQNQGLNVQDTSLILVLMLRKA